MKKKYNFEAEPFGRAFVENRDKSTSEQIAAGLYEAAKYGKIVFTEKSMLPHYYQCDGDGVIFYTYGGLEAYWDSFDELKKAHPENAADLDEIGNFMRSRTTAHTIWDMSLTGFDRKYIENKLCWGGNWIGHSNPDYDMILHLGTDGLRAKIEACRAKNPGNDGFYNASATALDAVDRVGDRIAKIAAENAAKETDEKKRAEWLRISAVFRIIPRKSAYDMYSATMLFWLFFTFDGTDSPGRLDQFMYDYYKLSSPEESEEMITRLLEAIHELRAWNLCISGSDKDRNDETNELSYLILRKVTEMKYQTPNLTLRLHKNSPEKLWKMAAECIGTGIGLPALYNDEVVVPALMDLGISEEDAHNYCMNGCNQIDIMGKSHMGLEDGEVNLAKCLEICLHNGCDYAGGSPELVTPRFGNPRDCGTFRELLGLYYKMLDYAADSSAEVANRLQKAYADFTPNPLRSVTIQGCLEKARDYKNGGPVYGHGQILLEGIADAADSLWAIKTLVYERKKYTMDELITALEDNFEGHEALRQDFAACDKFGNDIPELDELCAETVDHVFKRLKTMKTYRGGYYSGGCSPFERAAENGVATGALPNGKRRGESNFADSVAATPGCDVCGPTAAIKSMLHYRQKECGSGFVAQMKFSKTVFCTERGMTAFIALAKAYFAGGGQHLSVNVVDRATLLAAQAEPEKYKNLVVRVGGYSDYFVNLSPELQQNVIDRAEFTL